MRKLLILLQITLCSIFGLQAQYTSLNAHSHNDYEQKQPFTNAYSHFFGSIEADIWEVNGELFVAHDRAKIQPEKTIETLYILPIVELFRQNQGKAWKNRPGTFQLMIDLKTAVEPTLSTLIAKVKKYPDVFDSSVNPNAVQIVITGNRPSPSEFKNYPDFIRFDGNVTRTYDTPKLQRIALFSENLKNFTSWNGEEMIPAKEEARLKQIIDSVHGINNKIRFWNAPDSPKAWLKLMEMKVDFINTDHIEDLSKYINSIH